MASEDTLLSDGEAVVDLRGYRVWRGDGAVSLSPREHDILAFLWNARGRVMTRAELQELLPGRTTPRAIDVAVSRMRKKLGDHGGAWVETVRNVGYRLNWQISAPQRIRGTSPAGTNGRNRGARNGIAPRPSADQHRGSGPPEER